MFSGGGGGGGVSTPAPLFVCLFLFIVIVLLFFSLFSPFSHSETVRASSKRPVHSKLHRFSKFRGA